jgi:hypothetical protein
MNIERRSKTRYPIELTVNYQSMDPRLLLNGEGRSRNVSSTGVLVSCGDQLPEGTSLKVTLEWPTLLNGVTPLQLVTFGKVARSDDHGFALELDSYQFRTTRRKAERAADASIPPPGERAPLAEAAAAAMRRAG